MDQISINTSTKTLVNSINTDTIKDQGPHQFHTLKKTDTIYFSLQRTLFINKRASREKLLQNNHKNGSLPKYFNKNTDTSKTTPLQATIDLHEPKVNSVHFEDPYENINSMYNTHDETHLLDTHVEQNREYYEDE